jgi:hypothetical protein
MAVRDFVDVDGVRWKVWPVTPEMLHPKTAAEDYLGEYEGGWLCFESLAERRRLAGYPEDWDKLPDAELCDLLDTAAVVRERKTPHLPPDLPTP